MNAKETDAADARRACLKRGPARRMTIMVDGGNVNWLVVGQRPLRLGLTCGGKPHTLPTSPWSPSGVGHCPSCSSAP